MKAYMSDTHARTYSLNENRYMPKSAESEARAILRETEPTTFACEPVSSPFPQDRLIVCQVNETLDALAESLAAFIGGE